MKSNTHKIKKERKKGVCARWDSKTSRSRGSTSESQKLDKIWANPKDLSLGAFLKGGGGGR